MCKGKKDSRTRMASLPQLDPLACTRRLCSNLRRCEVQTPFVIFLSLYEINAFDFRRALSTSCAVIRQAGKVQTYGFQLGSDLGCVRRPVILSKPFLLPRNRKQIFIRYHKTGSWSRHVILDVLEVEVGEFELVHCCTDVLQFLTDHLSYVDQ